MASTTRASKPLGTTRRRSIEASLSFAASLRASLKLALSAQVVSVKGHRLRRRFAIGSEHDLVDTRLRLAQLAFAMLLQQRAALVRRKRIVELGVAGLEAPDNVLKLLECVFEAELSNFGRRRSLRHRPSFPSP